MTQKRGREKKRRESLKREHSGGRSGTVTAVIDESHDQRMSHLYTFTAQDHTHHQHIHARTHAHIPFELHSNFAAGSPDGDWEPCSLQPACRDAANQRLVAGGRCFGSAMYCFHTLLALRVGNTPPP